MQRPKRLVAGLSSLWPEFNPRPVYVEFVVDNVVLIQGFLSAYLNFSPSL